MESDCAAWQVGPEPITSADGMPLENAVVQQ